MSAVRFALVPRLIKHRAFVALVDQAAVSIASFGTGMLLSRAFVGPRREQLGLYYLAITIGILIGELQNSLVSAPHTITAPTLDPQTQRHFNGSSLIHHGMLSLVITLVLALTAAIAPFIGIASHAPMLLACAAAAGAIGLRNFARFLNFALHRPHVACLGDWIVTLCQLIGIVLLTRMQWLSAWSVVVVIGMASLVGGGLMLVLSLETLRPRWSRAWKDFRNNWKLSRWVFASGVIGNAGLSLYPWIIDRLSSTLQTALWGNCGTISSSGNPLLMGLQNWIAPAVSHAYAERRGRAFGTFVLRRALLFLAVMPLVLLMLWFISGPMLRRLYRDDTPHAEPLVLLLAAGSIIASMNFVISRGLFSLGHGKLDVWANVVPIPVLLTIGLPLVSHGGAMGAAISLLIAQALGAIVRAAIFWKISIAAPRGSTAQPLETILAGVEDSAPPMGAGVAPAPVA